MGEGRKVRVVRLSDNLLAPRRYVAEIRRYGPGDVEYGWQRVGEKRATWRRAKTVAEARAAIRRNCPEAATARAAARGKNG